jgi:hypothetical protein
MEKGGALPAFFGTKKYVPEIHAKICPIFAVGWDE